MCTVVEYLNVSPFVCDSVYLSLYHSDLCVKHRLLPPTSNLDVGVSMSTMTECQKQSELSLLHITQSAPFKGFICNKSVRDVGTSNLMNWMRSGNSISFFIGNMERKIHRSVCSFHIPIHTYLSLCNMFVDKYKLF